ncbi:hypothetical protein FNV43_RR09390 [Rhamnella rubrinervis]|uniref:Zinc-ribbon domain-containing protein n=1 Tax=Rhamnella rubrinervis TaxID=2594499 RepID=A0A8K0HA06_9ROSA|nr:hypothetical protein FNV43_RR09390 [Rhamnella rubrinervis]
MAEGPKVRLVRCPKCDNLLPELPDFPVYKCGGCGAVLRAKKKASESDVLSEKSEEERVVGSSDKLESLVDKWGDGFSLASETDKESDGIVLSRRKERPFVDRKTNFISSYSTGTEVDKHLNFREGPKDLRLKQSVAENEYGSIDRFGRFSEHQDDQWTHGADHYMNINMSDSVHSSVGEILNQPKRFAGSVRTRASLKRQDIGGARFEGLYGSPKAIAEQGRTPNFAYPDEGPSRPDSYNGHGHWMKSGDDVSVPNGVKDLEHDQSALLRKLEELKEQLSRSYNVGDTPRERVSVNRTPPDPYGHRATYNVSMQPTSLEEQIPRPPYFNYSHGPSFMNQHNIDMQNFYPPQRHILNEIPEYEDPSRPQMSRKPHEPSHKYSQQPSHEYFMAQYKDFNLNPHTSCPHETFFHQPACSCLHCQNWLVPPQGPPHVIGNRRFPHVSTNSNLYHHVNPVMFGPGSHHPRVVNSTLQSHDPHLNKKCPSDLDSVNDSHGQSYPKRMVAARGIGKLYHPIAGGAPFITCCNCFELLKLHRKLTIKNNDQKKLQCGACSTVMVVEIKNKKLISIPWESKLVSPELDQGSSEVLKDSLLSSHGLNAGCTNSCSEDFNSSDYNFQLAGTNLLVEDQRLNSDESEMRQGHISTISISSKEEESPDCATVRQDVSNSAELPSKNTLSPTSPGSPLWKQFDSPKHVISGYEKGNKSKFSNDKMVSRVTSRQNSVKDMAVTTEVDFSFNEYLDTCISQDSAEVSKEEDQPTISKGTDSSLVGFIKKSFKDYSRSNQYVEDERPNVTINGQPIPERVVRKAEKLAGPVCPGDYWYDIRAGFWGAMGQPCLGIIPPFIEEFNYPMPKNCAAGNTGVYINGRELHQRDLDLLSSRGLPTTRDRFYTIEISGRVLDEDSGKEFSLGKLAPTVEKAKHGFGMKIPKNSHVTSSCS